MNNCPDILRDENGSAYELDKSLGAGGQGVVFLATNNRYAIKFRGQQDAGIVAPSENKGEAAVAPSGDEKAYDKYAKKIRKLIAIENLVDIDCVAFPIALLERPNCGYVMRFMEGMVSLSSMVNEKKTFISSHKTNGSLHKRFKVLKKLAETLLKMHGNGLIYGDLSPNNIFVSEAAKDSETWLIDADNITYENRSKKAIGTPGYRAPEICLGACANSIKSDMYSFALIAFEYLTGNKPFEAAPVAVDDEQSDDNEWNGGDAFDYEQGGVPYVYEFDNNGAGRMPLELVCTSNMSKLFMRTFCEKGRSNPLSRPSASDWVAALDEACNSVCTCADDEPHDFLVSDCGWCRYLGHASDNVAVYRLSAIYMPNHAAEEKCWDETPRREEFASFLKSTYFSFNLAAKRKASISVDKNRLFPSTVKCDFSNVDVTIDKNLSVKIEGCNFRTSYDGKPLTLNKAISGSVRCRDVTVKLVLERIR